MQEKKHIFTIGLRRSGTTAFWDLFRQDKRFLSFDEPFNSLFWASACGVDNGKNSYTEYMYHKDFFLKNGSHIESAQELTGIMFGHQMKYVRDMCQLNENMNINFTRLHLKIDTVRMLCPDALIVLLIRDPRAWVTSQLKPKGKWLEGYGLPENFFSFNGNYDHWRYMYMSVLLQHEGVAYEKLLQLWKMLNYKAELFRPDMIIQFEDFCHRPEHFVSDIYDRLQLDKPDLNYDSIHLPNLPFDIHNNKWWDGLAKYDIDKYIWNLWSGSKESKDYLFKERDKKYARMEKIF